MLFVTLMNKQSPVLAAVFAAIAPQEEVGTVVNVPAQQFPPKDVPAAAGRDIGSARC